MSTDKLLDQLETYSNAIVGFIIAQSLVFSFTYGNNPAFSCVVAKQKLLAALLLAHFGVGTALAVTAIYYLSRQIQRLSKENTELVRVVFHAKAGAVALFTLIPIALLIVFGVYGVPGTGRCTAPVRAALLLFDAYVA